MSPCVAVCLVCTVPAFNHLCIVRYWTLALTVFWMNLLTPSRILGRLCIVIVVMSYRQWRESKKSNRQWRIYYIKKWNWTGYRSVISINQWSYINNLGLISIVFKFIHAYRSVNRLMKVYENRVLNNILEGNDNNNDNGRGQFFWISDHNESDKVSQS